jgi:hypothetical protein
MFKSIVLLSFLASIAAFSNNNAAIRSTQLNAKSKALPFLDAPSKLDGTAVGDFGFDPLGLTDTLTDLNYVKAAELKHGRVAMLATVGFIFQQYVHIVSPEADPIKAIAAVGFGPNLQILSAIGVVELATWDKTFLTDSAGDLGFDPLGQLKGKSAKQVAEIKLKEIKNGRLAMIAIIGLIVQNLIFDGRPSLSF